MEMRVTPPGLPTHTFFRRNVGRCASTWAPRPPFPHPEQSFALLYFLSQKSLTVASFYIFPPLLSLQDCIHSGHCSFLTLPGREPAASGSCRSSVLGVEWVSFSFQVEVCVSLQEAAVHFASFYFHAQAAGKATRTPGTVCDRTANILRCLVRP